MGQKWRRHVLSVELYLSTAKHLVVSQCLIGRKQAQEQWHEIAGRLVKVKHDNAQTLALHTFEERHQTLVDTATRR